MIARFKTHSQKRREREYRKIISLYNQIRASDSTVGPYAAYAEVARAFSRSTTGIRYIIEHNKNI